MAPAVKALLASWPQRHSVSMTGKATAGQDERGDASEVTSSRKDLSCTVPFAFGPYPSQFAEEAPGSGPDQGSPRQRCRKVEKRLRRSPINPNRLARATDAPEAKRALREGAREAEPDSGKRLKPPEPLPELRHMRQIAGLRIWEPLPPAPPTSEPVNAIVAWDSSNAGANAADAGGQPEAPASTLCRSSSRTVEAHVRAEGLNVSTSSPHHARGAPCRCVVRGKEQRQALPGHDCEMCRRFYAATGITGANGVVAGPKSSRHRSEHAPTNTPPGTLCRAA